MGSGISNVNLKPPAGNAGTVTSVTGNIVDNTDPANPVVTFAVTGTAPIRVGGPATARVVSIEDTATRIPYYGGGGVVIVGQVNLGTDQYFTRSPVTQATLNRAAPSGLGTNNSYIYNDSGSIQMGVSNGAAAATNVYADITSFYSTWTDGTDRAGIQGSASGLIFQTGSVVSPVNTIFPDTYGTAGQFLTSAGSPIFPATATQMTWTTPGSITGFIKQDGTNSPTADISWANFSLLRLNTITDNAGLLAVDIGNKKIYNGASLRIDYGAGIMYGDTGSTWDFASSLIKDDSAVLVVNFVQRKLYDSAAVLSVNFDNRTLAEGATTAFTWDASGNVSNVTLSMNSTKITSLAAPTVGGDAANKTYVDGFTPLVGSATNNDIATLTAGGATQDSGKAFSTDGTMASNSDLLISTQKAGKTYADTKLALAGGTLTGNVTSNSSIKTSGQGGFGYTTGAGGTVTQLTNKGTAVILDKVAGDITMNNALLGPSAIISFNVSNSSVAQKDFVAVFHESGGTVGSYLVSANTVANGQFAVTVRNVTVGALSEAIVLRYIVIKSVVA